LYRDAMEILIEEFVLSFLQRTGASSGRVELDPIRGDGSKRRFWRVAGSGKAPGLMAMANPPVNKTLEKENSAYLLIGRHLREKGLPIPRILFHDLEKGLFLLEDLGSRSLQDKVASLDDPVPVYREVLRHLLRLQTRGAEGFDTAWCCQTKRYDRSVMRTFESDYFRDAFLRGYLGLKEGWPELEAPFDHLAKKASLAGGGFFLHRDFQSRNIMIPKGGIGFIDWQGGRLGPLGYDLASLLLDPYTGLSARQRETLFLYYLDMVREMNPQWADPLERYFPCLAVQRNLQILGAFAFLSRVMKKEYFEAYIPPALKTLSTLLHTLDDPGLSPLTRLVDGITAGEKFLDTQAFPE